MFQIKISNLPKWVSELHLKHFFEGCGGVVEASIALSKESHRPLGHGYVTFSNELSAQKAVDKDGSRFDGAVIKIGLSEQHQMVEELPEPGVV